MEHLCVELGDNMVLTKLLSIAELNPVEALSRVVECLVDRPKSAIIGITGPQGVGKSTIIATLIKELSEDGYRVAALLVDPSSPLSGGAVLGNRLRISELPRTAYIRSLWAEDEKALPLRAVTSLEVLEAAGYDYVLVETPGAGQVNTSILKVSDLVVVVLMPLLGDEVQVIKAGLMEIGDLYVVNKSDVPESEIMYNYVRSLVKNKPVLKVSALYRRGVKELVDTIKSELDKKKSVGAQARKRIERRMYLVEETLLEQMQQIIREELKEINSDQLLRKPSSFTKVITDLKTRLAKRFVEGP